MATPNTEFIEAKVIKAFIVEGHSHRKIQEEILELLYPQEVESLKQ